MNEVCMFFKHQGLHSSDKSMAPLLLFQVSFPLLVTVADRLLFVFSHWNYTRFGQDLASYFQGPNDMLKFK